MKEDSNVIRLGDADLVADDQPGLPPHLRMTGQSEPSIAPSTREIRAEVGSSFVRRHAGKSAAFVISVLATFGLFGAVRVGAFSSLGLGAHASTTESSAATVAVDKERVSVSAFQRPRATRVDSRAGVTIARESAKPEAEHTVSTLADPPTHASHASSHRAASHPASVSLTHTAPARPGSAGALFDNALGAPVTTTITPLKTTAADPPKAEAPPPVAAAPAAKRRTASLEDELLNASR